MSQVPPNGILGNWLLAARAKIPKGTYRDLGQCYTWPNAERIGSSEPERGMSKLAATIISGLLRIGGPTVLFAQTSGEQGRPEYPQSEDGFSAQIAAAVRFFRLTPK